MAGDAGEDVLEPDVGIDPSPLAGSHEAAQHRRRFSALVAAEEYPVVAADSYTADGALGTRSVHDFRAASPNQADIVVFPKDDWTLNKVDATNTVSSGSNDGAVSLSA